MLSSACCIWRAVLSQSAYSPWNDADAAPVQVCARSPIWAVSCASRPSISAASRLTVAAFAATSPVETFTSYAMSCPPPEVVRRTLGSRGPSKPARRRSVERSVALVGELAAQLQHGLGVHLAD